LSVKSQMENILGFVGQHGKLRTLVRYLHNKREDRFPQNLMKFK